MTPERRGEIECEIVTKIVETALSKDLILEVRNGERSAEIRSNIREDILKKMFQTDMERIEFYTKLGGARLGWIYFVYGNDGYDVIVDYTSNELTESIIEFVQPLVDKYEMEAA